MLPAALRVFLCLLLTFSPVVHAGVLSLRTATQDGLLAKFDPASRERPGICLEIIYALQRVDPTLRFTGLARSMSTTRIEQEMQQGTLDVFFGFLKTPARERHFRFIDPPLFFQHSRVAVRAGDRVQIASLADIAALGRDGVVLATQGTAHVPYLRAVTGLRVDDGALSSHANLQKLLLGRGRFFYQGDLNLASDIRRYQLSDKVRILPLSFRREAQYVAFSRQVPPEAVARVERALQALQRSGELDAIFRRYAPTIAAP